MTDQLHPITPPPELVKEWYQAATGADYEQVIATQAARWGWEQRGAVNEAELQKARDEELEACCEWMEDAGYQLLADKTRAARRPPAIPETIEVDGRTYRLVK